MMRFVAVVAAAFLLCAGGGAAGAVAQKADISQLEGLDMPEGLQQFLGSVLTEMQEIKNKAQIVEVELRDEVSRLKKERDAFQNKTRVIESELRRENAALRLEVTELRDQTKRDLQRINARLDQCEAETFAEVVERRQTQDQAPACGREAVDSMLAVCCTAPVGNGHRLQESVGCDSLPSTCSLQCSYQFISIFDSCHDDALMRGLSAEQLADWTSFYAVCSEVEQSAAEMGELQPVNVRMFRIMISSDAAQSQAEMFGGQGQTEPIIGPLPELPPAPPASSSDSGSTDVEQYHAQCTTANILTCVPECNATHHGFELIATIDGTDTKFNCNLANMLFSWVGAAALGGFLGINVQAFVSAVISGAAGTYVLTLTEDADVRTDLVIQPGQSVIINGDAGLVEAPRWGTGGFTVGEMGSLSWTHLSFGNRLSVSRNGMAQLEQCALDSSSSLIVTGGGSLGLSSMMLPSQVLSDVQNHLSGNQSTLTLFRVTVLESVSVGPLSGTMVVGIDGITTTPPDAFAGHFRPSWFVVNSGPCTVSQGGRCVGRPQGYGPDESCTIAVGGVVDILAIVACSIRTLMRTTSLCLMGPRTMAVIARVACCFHQAGLSNGSLHASISIAQVKVLWVAHGHPTTAVQRKAFVAHHGVNMASVAVGNFVLCKTIMYALAS